MDNKLQVVVADLDTGTEILASAKFDSDQPANGDSYQALLSASGRHVIFQSRATDLGFTDANDSQDLFLRDLETQTTWLLSRNADGSGSGNSQSLACQLSLDGRVAVFESFASDLVPGDLNQSRDIFMIRLGSPDTDQDGMDDDWEVAYFGNLSEQSGSDYDKDGLSNLEEFKAGTNPTNRESVLRVLMLESVTKGWRTLLWSSQPGKRYQVQFKDELTRANWNSLGEIVLAQDAHCQLVDQMPPSSSQRFYRVKLVE